jgi:hypothetical protein
MSKLLKLAGTFALVMSMALSGCVMISSSSIGERGATGAGVTAESDGWGWLMLMTPEGLTTAANAKLAASCPSGKFTNPQTELAVRNFLGIAQYYMVTADAVCQ